MQRELYACTAGDLATRSVATRAVDTTVGDTLAWLESEGFDVAPVVDGETVLGYVDSERSRGVRPTIDSVTMWFRSRSQR